MNKKKVKSKVVALFLGFAFALLILELSLRFFGTVENFQRTSDTKIIKADFTILNIGNSHTVGTGAPPGKDYSTQLEMLLNQKKTGQYAVINRGRVNVNTSYIKENISEWIKTDRPNLVFIMAGEANRWNKYKFSNFLVEKKQHTKFKLITLVDQFRFFRSLRLFELLINQETMKTGYSDTFKNVSLTDNPRYLGYLWLGHLDRDAVYKTKKLSKAQAMEALSALDYIYKVDHNPAAARLSAAIYLQIFHDEDLFLKNINESIKTSKGFNYETWQLFRLNESLMGEKSRLFIKSYIEKINYDSLPLTIKEMEEWYLFEKPLKLISKEDEISFIKKLSYLNPSDARLFESLDRRNASLEILFDVAERICKLNPQPPQANILSILSLRVKNNPEYEKKLIKLIQLSNEVSGVVIDQKQNNDDDLEKEWIISDIESIINIIQLSGAKVVIQTYVPYRNGNPRFIDMTLRQWWKQRTKTDVEFMDVGQVLGERFKKENDGVKYYSTRFGGKDEHPGSLGYYEIAKLMVPYVKINSRK